MNVQWIGSPNYSKGRGNKKIEFIVCHWIVGDLAAADAVFKSVKEVSAHYAVGDNEVHQYVKDADTAWHCGSFADNQRSIGIEHKGGPNLPISEETYRTSARLIWELCKQHGLPLERSTLRKHNEFKPTQCPGTLDLDKLITYAKEHDLKADIQADVDIARKEFAAAFITWVTRWPTDEEVQAWRNSGQLPWEYVQNAYINPELNLLKKELTEAQNKPVEVVEKIVEKVVEKPVEVVVEKVVYKETGDTMLKGKRTYVAIVLTALVYGLQQTGVIDATAANWLIGMLTAAGLYFRAQA